MRRSKFALVRALGALCLVAAMLTGCSMPGSLPTVDQYRQEHKAALKPSVSTPDLHEDGVLIVGVKASDNDVPFSFVEDNKLKGFEVDLASALADQMQLEVRFVRVASTHSAAAQSCDIIMGVQSGDPGEFTIVGRYAEEAHALFSYSEVSGTPSISDLASKSVAVQSNSVSQQLLKRSNLVMTERGFESTDAAFDAFREGSTDYWLTDAYTGFYIASFSYDKKINLVGTLEAPSSMGIAVSKDKTGLVNAIQSAYEKVSSNGVLEVIRGRWLGGMKPLSSDNIIKNISLEQNQTAPAEEGSNAESNGTSNTNTGGVSAGANAVTMP